MEQYELDEDEVVLYEGMVKLNNKSLETKLILTNKNLVFLTTTKSDLMVDVISTEVFPVNDVKEYNGTFQVLRKGNVVEIYFLHNEVEFTFEKGNECRDFMNAVLKLLTGKNKFERGAEKFFKGKDCVDNSLHIDSSSIAKKTVNFFTTKKMPILNFGKKKDK